MSQLETFVTEYLSATAGAAFIRQYLVICALFVFGAVLTDKLLKDMPWPKRSVLIFPAGFSAFVVTAYVMIVAGIPYNKWTVPAVILCEAAVAAFLNRNSYKDGIGTYKKHMAITAVAALIIAAFATSGIAPVSISNDTMYFFRRYPDSIVYYGGLRDQFDFWMTDTGLGIVSVDTLPALFGFGESFGIREFFHIDFLLFFGISIYYRAKNRMGQKNAVISAVLITLLLEAATPFTILGHWALANMYFMEMFFMCAFTAVDHEQGASSVLPLMLLALSFFRIEGTMFVVWLVLCIALYTGLGRRLALYCLLPMTVLFGAYSLKVFVYFYVLDDIYLFLTPVKALLLVCLAAGSTVYIAFICPRFGDRLKRSLPWIYILAMAGGNLLLFVRDSGLYTGNLKAFYSNLFRQSGWGMLPYFVVAATILFVAEYVIARIKKSECGIKPDPFTLVLTTGFLLMVIAASYGRGDVLAEDVGDSGNRVLLQIVPLVVMLYGEMASGLAGKSVPEEQ